MAAINQPHEVANLALGLIGQRQLLNSLEEDSTEAQMAKLYFAPTRDELLAAWDWRFARARAVLALTTEERTGWTYCYAAPTGMLAARRIWDGTREPGEGERIPFDKELNDAGDGHLIVTDQPDAELVYTRSLETVALWPQGFVKAVAAQMAVYLAGALPVKPGLARTLQPAATLALQQAAAQDAREAQRDPEAEAEAIRVR